MLVLDAAPPGLGGQKVRSAKLAPIVARKRVDKRNVPKELLSTTPTIDEPVESVRVVCVWRGGGGSREVDDDSDSDSDSDNDGDNDGDCDGDVRGHVKIDAPRFRFGGGDGLLTNCERSQRSGRMRKEKRSSPARASGAPRL
ncbi:MAG: hypothetical protein M1815_001286 [Lichina confinis]|nr:MAG: hypothetical protein M1815_001286 [Lichina confinis]